MKWGFGLAAPALLASAISLATTVDQVVVLDRPGSNFDIDAAPNGNLHVVFRSGGANQTAANWHDIYYVRYTAGSGWGSSVRVFDGGDRDVSSDIDTNQPAIAWDPSNMGSWIVFSGNVRFDNQVPAYFVDDATSSPSLQGNLLGSLGSIRELRAVDIAIADDGHLWGCFNFTNVVGSPDINGIYCNNDGGSVERATDRTSSGEGLSVALGPGGKPHVLTTFGRTGTNAAWSPRDAALGLVWSPGGLQFGGIPLSAGKVSCLDTADNNKLDCAAVTASEQSNQRISFLFTLDRGAGPATVVKASAAASWGVSTAPGDWNSENIEYARSAQGKEAIAYAQDADPNGPLDLAIVLVKPAGVDWPQTPFTDAKGDGIHDEIGGIGQTPREYFTGPNPELFRVFEGQEGRAAIAFVTGETPSVGFSGEDLWVVFLEDDLPPRKTKAAKITIGPLVPEVSMIGALLVLVGFSALLAAAGAGRNRRGPRTV